MMKQHTIGRFIAVCVLAVGACAHASPVISGSDGVGNFSYTVVGDPCTDYCWIEELPEGETLWIAVAIDGNSYVAVNKPSGVHAYRFVDVEIDYEFGQVYTWTSQIETIAVGTSNPPYVFVQLESAVEVYFQQLLLTLNATSAQASAAETDLQTVANSQAQYPDILYTAEELVVANKLRLLEQHDSRFQGTLPTDVSDWISVYDDLVQWSARGL